MGRLKHGRKRIVKYSGVVFVWIRLLKKKSMFSCKQHIVFFFLVFPLFKIKNKNNKIFLFYLIRKLLVKCHRVAQACSIDYR